MAYARELTGVSLDGNAASWWPHAEGRYERGHKPEIGAILVFKPYGGMRVGHVAVVSQVIGPREVLVDQANWVRGRVTKAMSVIDASPLNDWTSVKVQYAGTHGRENPTYGFIYSHASPADVADAAEPDSHHADRVAAHTRHHKHADEQDVAAADDSAPRHADRVAAHTRHHTHADKPDVAAAADDPAPRHIAVAEHATHRKVSAEHDDTMADASAPTMKQLAVDQPHHKHKANDNTRLAYVVY